jgi:hypothetical protein
MIMRSTSYTRGAATVLALALGAMPLVVAPAAAKPSDAVRRRAFSLFAVPIGILQVNNVFCPVSNRGKVCVNQNDNPALEGGFWPRGTPDSYIYNSGLQIGGVIQNSPFTSGTADTVGVYFMDPRGSQFEGEGLTNVYNSANTDDAAAWPNGAVARDTSLYNSVLLGRNVVSQQDLWVRVWDGNPANSIGGSHPLGIVVDQRGMAWNYPTGNEDIIYFIYTVYNVSASNRAKYTNPTIDPALQDEIAAIGTRFKGLNDQRYGINIPADGYDISSTFLAFFEDCDVGVNSASNYATANFVFNLSYCYKSDFNDPPPDFTYPPDIFSPPLFVGVGFTGVKYLRSPVDDAGNELGLTLFSNTGNPTSSGGAGYIDSRGSKQLYRYLSGTSSPAAGDNSCTNQGQQLALRYCFLFQVPVDARFLMSSGPFTLKAGESRTIVVAYVQAGALATAFTGPCTPGPAGPTHNCQASPPPSPTDLATGADTIRTIDKIAGWVSATDNKAPIGTITQNEVTTVPRTLFNKSLVAQTVFDNKFLLPFAPEQPQFFLIPGDSSVTVVWRPSVTEGTGDPFFQVASDPTSPLYDPNFRQFDVEGYRVYRGRSASSLELIAQFDYAGTVIKDFVGGMAYDGKCAPELGVTDDCPAAFPTFFQPGISPAVDPTQHADQVLAGNVVQVKLSRSPRVQKIDGSIVILSTDTAVTGGGTGGSCRPSACLPLTDNAVPFAFVDHNVRNEFTYLYAVTAFDVNSLQSGPSSLESPKTTLKAATPRPASGQETAGSLQPPVMVGGNGQVLNPNVAPPQPNAATGIFPGPMPPTNGVQLGLAAFIPEVLTSGTITMTIDSVVPGSALIGPVAARYYVTGKGSGAPTSVVIPIFVDGFSDDSTNSVPFPATPVITSKGARFGGDTTFSLSGSGRVTVPGTWRTASWGRGSANADPAGSDENGPRWWSGAANENTPAPNSLVCVPSAGGCVQADLSLNAGSLPGVDSIFHVQSYSTVPNVPQRNLEGISSTVYRAADFRIKWGASGAIDSVRDVTHNLPVPFSTKIRASWGILNDSSFLRTGGPAAGSTPDGNNTLLTWTDIYCVDPVPSYLGNCGGSANPTAFLMNHARSTPIALTASAFGSPPGAANGNGFIFYINGHFFLMKLTGGALPAAGTVWNVRFYSGAVTGSAGSYAFEPATRPPAVPGLQMQIAYVGTTFDSTTTNDSVLAKVHTVPDPYYVTNALEISPNIKVLKFVHLPARCIIRIYSTSAILVRVLTHDDPTGGSEESWNLRNRNNQFVASGVYFYHVEAPDGKTKIGRFTVVNFAP